MHFRIRSFGVSHNRKLTQQTLAMVLAWENLQETFVMLVVVVVFYLTGGFALIAFRRHSSPFRELSPGFYTHFIPSAQLITE